MLTATRKISRVDRSVLASLPEPVALGPRHRPIHHAALVDKVSALQGGEPSQILLSNDRASMFATWDLDGVNRHGYTPQIMMRHDNAQRRALEFSLGATVFVCSNGMITTRTTATARRKHTTGLDWRGWVEEAYHDKLLGVSSMERTVDRLRGMEMDSDRWAGALLDYAAKGLIPHSTAVDAWKHWLEPAHEDFHGGTAWSAYNSVNEALKTVAVDRQENALLRIFQDLSRLN